MLRPDNDGNGAAGPGAPGAGSARASSAASAGLGAARRPLRLPPPTRSVSRGSQNARQLPDSAPSSTCGPGSPASAAPGRQRFPAGSGERAPTLVARPGPARGTELRPRRGRGRAEPPPHAPPPRPPPPPPAPAATWARPPPRAPQLCLHAGLRRAGAAAVPGAAARPPARAGSAVAPPRARRGRG